MKTVIKYLSLVVLISLFTVSCKKEEIKPGKITVVEDEPNVSPVGYTWELVSAKLFVIKENGATGQVVSKTYYDHFGNGQTTSNLDAFVPSTLPIDNITQGSTTWQVGSSGMFTLNGNQQYNYQYNWPTGLDMTLKVIGLENGSTKVITSNKCTNDFFHVKAHISYYSDASYDYEFYTILEFVKVGGSGVNTPYTVPPGFTYGGVWATPNTPNPNDMTNQKWIVTRYNNGLSGNVYPDDTLEFVSQTQYKINNGSLKNYTLSSVVGNNMKSLSLYSFTTLGGDYSGQIQSSFMSDWSITNSNFTDMFNVNNTVTVWMTRIQ